MDKVMDTYKGTFIVAPALLIIGVIGGSIAISSWYDLWFLTSVKIMVSPLPLIVMMVVGVAGNFLRVFVHKHKPGLDPKNTVLMGVLAMFMVYTPFILGPVQADIGHYRSLDSYDGSVNIRETLLNNGVKQY